MKWIKSLFGKQEEIRQDVIISKDLSQESKQDMSIEQAQQVLNNAQRLVNELKWKNDAPQILPIAQQYLKELQAINTNFEDCKTPEQLESCKEQLLVILQWFVKQEQKYPDAPWLIQGTAVAMRNKVRIRYNELIYNLAKKYYGKSIIGFIDKSADNYEQTKIAISQEDGFDEEEVRDLRRALQLGQK